MSADHYCCNFARKLGTLWCSKKFEKHEISPMHGWSIFLRRPDRCVTKNYNQGRIEIMKTSQTSSPNWFHYLPTIITPKLLLTYFFSFVFLSVPEFQTTPTIPLPIMNIFIIFFVKEKKKAITPQFLFWNVKLIERLIWLLKNVITYLNQIWVQSFVFS